MKKSLFMLLLLCVGFSMVAISAEITYELKGNKVEILDWEKKVNEETISGSERFVVIVLDITKDKLILCHLIDKNLNERNWVGTGRRYSAVIEDEAFQRILRGDTLPFGFHLRSNELKSIREIDTQRAKNLKQKDGLIPSGMVLISGGPFQMGCTEGDMNCQYNETPVHRVLVKPFYMDKTEVTVKAYKECVDAGTCVPPPLSTGTYCNWGKAQREDHPINCVEWAQAKEYCTWVWKRLPSEAEWEFAARGGHIDWQYPWGNDDANCKRAVMDGMQYSCSRESTAIVGSMGAFGFGLYDMAGNVDEWVEDCWHDDYIGAPTDGTAWTSGDCSNRVFRGGSWLSGWVEVRVTVRGPKPFDDPPEAKGFRCAITVQ